MSGDESPVMNEPVIPELIEIEPGVFAFQSQLFTNPRAMFGIFAAIGSTVSALALAGTFTNQNAEWYVAPLVIAVAIVWTAAAGVFCFHSVHCIVDTKSRSLQHNFLLFGRVWRRRQRQVQDGDSMAIYQHREHRRRHWHAICLIRGRTRWTLRRLRMPDNLESPEIEELTGRIAELLEIPSGGYDGPKFLWY